MKFVRFTIITLLMSSAVFSTSILAEELVVYSGRKAKFVKPLIEKFTEQTGIPVKLKSGKSTNLLSILSLEGSKTEADLYIGNDVGNLQRGSDFGLFREIPQSILRTIPKEHRSPYNDWLGLSGRLRVLVVNTKSQYVNELDSIYDLANPALKGKIGITHGGNESFIGGVTSYMHLVGKEKNRDWLNAIKTNADGKQFKKHSKIVQAVAKGEKDVGLVNHYYALRHMKKHPEDPIQLVIPDQQNGQIGIAWNMAGIGISRYTKNSEAAEKLVAFLISEEGQKVFAEVNQEYPTRRGVPLAKGVPAIDSVNITKTPIEEIGRQREYTVLEIQRIGL